MHFENKVAAITGAGSGIGRALARSLARRRCHLALSDIHEAGLLETAEDLRDTGVRITTEVLDVARREAVHAWADAAAADHGKVNLVFNNAGVALGSTVEDASYADLEWIMGINFWGVVYGTKAFLPHLKASGDGHVVNISSVLGLFSAPTQGAYNASKFAVRGFTESLRQEMELLGEPVGVTCVHPGGIKTNIAKTARISPKTADNVLGDPQKGREAFERAFRTTPEKAAEIILKAVAKNRRRALVGFDAVILEWLVRLLPTAHQRLITAATRKVVKGTASKASGPTAPTT